MNLPSPVRVRVRQKEAVFELSPQPGENLRELLLRTDHSPYQGQFKTLHCRGLGICGSCSVWVKEEGTQWKRRACQIRCFQDLEIEIQ